MSRKRVWITGASGMVGRNLLEHPKATAWDILAPSSRELDLRDWRSVLAYAQSTKPDIIIHTAGQVGGIQANMADPAGFLVNNLDIGRNVVLAGLEADIPELINLGSSCMYPRDRNHPLHETEIMTGELEPTNEGYALAKIVATRLCDYITRAHPAVCYRTLIPCNIYGRYDKFGASHSHLVAAIIVKIRRAQRDGLQEVDIWGDGSARREFMFAGDLADAIWRAADNPRELPKEMNIGVGHDHTILEYYQTVARTLDWQGHFRFDLSKPVGMMRKLNDIRRQTDWGWVARTPLEDGIKATTEFYKQWIEKDG